MVIFTLWKDPWCGRMMYDQKQGLAGHLVAVQAETAEAHREAGEESVREAGVEE